MIQLQTNWYVKYSQYLVYTKSQSQKVKDWQLILATLVVTGCGVILVVLQVAVPQFRADPELISDVESGNKLTVYRLLIFM